MGKTVVTIRARRKPKPPEYPDHQSMSADEITSFIEAHTWKFAKTMPFSPHSYVVKENGRDPREFERFVVTIRRHGYRTRYGKSYYTVLDHPTEDGTVSKFWTMGAPLNRTIIINRALKPGSPPSVFITALRSAADIIAAKADVEGKHDQAQEIRLAVTAASVGDWTYVQRLQIELPRFELHQFKPLRFEPFEPLTF
jgi:hypothetical protein